MMSEIYENFMIFGLESTGEKVKLDISETTFLLNNGQNVLDPNQVLIIVKEGLRRIYIWKGVNSHVRKKFIASRIAAELQNDLVVNSHFHRCKIISVDQGDEPYEFMRAFNFKTVEVPAILERDSKEFKQLHESSLLESAEIKDKKVHGWQGPPPTINGAVKSPLIVKKTENGIAPKPKQSIKAPKLDNKKVIDIIVKNKVPDNFKRQNLILGNFQIYGAAVKKAKIFGKEVEETEWEQVKSIPEGPIELKDRTIRLYVNGNSNSIEGIEILQKLDTTPTVEKLIEKKEKINYNSWTVSKLKLYCKENNITVPTSYRKAQIINLILGGSPQKITEQPLNYSKWTVKQLKEYCNENNLKVLASYRKADLVKLVGEHKT
ncbi:MAG: hypothetical protein ACTSO6_01695 [Promethearchaeota archaeon]